MGPRVAARVAFKQPSCPELGCICQGVGRSTLSSCAVGVARLLGDEQALSHGTACSGLVHNNERAWSLALCATSAVPYCCLRGQGEGSIP